MYSKWFIDLFAKRGTPLANLGKNNYNSGTIQMQYSNNTAGPTDYLIVAVFMAGQLSVFGDGLCQLHHGSSVVKPLMLHIIWAAVNRITRNGVSIGPEERLGVYEALKAVTINASYEYFEEDIKGTIGQGKLADLVILDKNPLEIDPMNIKDIQVVEMIKEGESLFKNDGNE